MLRQRPIATSPVSTGQKQGTRFKPGQSGNPAGRPKGARNRISESFLQELAAHFEASGKAAIDTVFRERPHDYLKIIATLIPKQLENEDVIGCNDVREMTDAELEAIIWKAANAMGGLSREEVGAAEQRLALRAGKMS